MRRDFGLLTVSLAFSVMIVDSTFSADSPNAKSRGAPNAVSIVEFGAKPGPENAVATRKAIQSALDALPADQAGLVRVPAGDWWIDEPILIDRSDVTLSGEGFASRINRGAENAGDLLLLGVKRLPLSRDHLDTLAGRPAIRLRGNTRLASFGGPLDQGGEKGYEAANGLTIDLMFAIPTEFKGDGVAICGLSVKDRPSPWSLWAHKTNEKGKGRYSFRFATRAPNGAARRGDFEFEAPLGPAVRLTIQLDLKAGVFAAWVNGLLVKANPRGDSLLPGSRFVANHLVPFGFGATGAQAWGGGDWFGSPADLVVAGLKLVSRPLYSVKAPRQQRLDRKPLDDALRYDTNEDGLLGYLKVPDTIPTNRVLDLVGSYNRPSTMLWLDLPEHGGYAATAGNVTIRDLWLNAQWYASGQVIGIGEVNNLRLEGLRIHGAAHGIGCKRFGVLYPIRVLNCDFAYQTAVSIDLFAGTAVMLRDLMIQGAGRSGALVAWRSKIVFDGAFISGFGQPSAVLRLVDCHATIRDVGADYEGLEFPSDAYILAESTGDSTDDTTHLTVERFGAGLVSPKAAIVRLTGSGEGVARIMDLATSKGATKHEAAVLIEGAGWKGHVEGTSDLREGPAVLGGKFARPFSSSAPPRAR